MPISKILTNQLQRVLENLILILVSFNDLKTGRFKFSRDQNFKLSDHQELALKKYIEFLDSIEISVRLPIIRDTANFLLYKAHLDENSHGLASRVRRN
jgi:hypothetical protein